MSSTAISMASPTAAPEGPPRAASTSGGNPYTVLFFGLPFLLLMALVFAYFEHVCCHRGRAERGSNGNISDPENPAMDAPPTPSQSQMVYNAATTKMAGSAEDCAICLAEFADGDAIRVMPACYHGFHASCIERWLAGGRRSSCPTCRAPAPAPAPAAQADEATNSCSWAGDYAGDLFCVIVFALYIALIVAVHEVTRDWK